MRNRALVAPLVVLVVVLVASCAASAINRKPEVPRVRCLPVGAVPNSNAWVYVCTFDGDTVPESVPLPGAGV